jgi:hypothetical protein
LSFVASFAGDSHGCEIDELDCVEGITVEQGKRRVDATPFASSLIEGHRDIGYSIETAIADIIDNCITAKARRVDIVADTTSDDPMLAIIDNGHGMDDVELIDAMRLGSKNPLEVRHAKDLGRFGLGLKSASFSQCRRLTVISRKGQKVTSATWDLDIVAERNDWKLEVTDNPLDLDVLDRLSGSGTAVIWEKLDRLGGGIANDRKKRAEHINAALVSAEHHIRLVFHRFLEGNRPKLRIYLNGRALQPIDPLAIRNPACQIEPEEAVPLSQGAVTIQCYTLPHHKLMTEAEWLEVGGPEGHLRSQGIYLYRGDRLIIAGGWMGLARQTELTKLCRVRVDIPNSMDALWKIDVKKASAQLPPAVATRLRRVIESFLGTSRRVYRRRGQKLVDHDRLPLWVRMQQDGRVIFRPNLGHPTFQQFEHQLPEAYRAGFQTCLKLLGSGLPIDALHADLLGNAEAVVEDMPDEAQVREMVEAVAATLLDAGVGKTKVKEVLQGQDFFRKAWPLAQPLIDQYLEDL